MLKDMAGAIIYDPMGSPIIMEYVKGTVEIINATPINMDPEEKPLAVSAGVGVAVNVVNNTNRAYINNATIKANNINLVARNGAYNSSDEAAALLRAASLSSVSALAGYSSGDFGMAGAIAVNVTDNDTIALVENAKLVIRSSLGNIRVESESLSNTTTTASATTVKGVTATVGVGSGISVGVLSETVTSEINTGTVIQTEGTGSRIGDVTVTAQSNGLTTVTAVAGTKGGKAISPAVVVNVVSTDTNAKIPAATAPAGALNVAGSITVTAISKRRKMSSANATAAGAQVAAGGAVVVDVASLNQNAVLERNVAGAGNITVHALGINTSETSAGAGSRGAAEKTEKKDGAGDEGASAVQSPSADEMAERGLASAKAVAGDLVSDERIPTKTPQKAETSEGAVSVAGAVALSIWNDATHAILTGTTNCSGLLQVLAETSEILTVSADASATVSQTGVGVTVAILVANVTNEALVKGNHTAGTMNIQAVMPQVDILDKVTGLPTGETTEGVNTIKVTSQSGAGASNVGVAGAVAINIYSADYSASVINAVLNTVGGESLIHSRIRHNILTKAGASEDLAAAGGTGTEGGTDKKTGIGASFALAIANIKSNAYIAENGRVTSKGSLKILAEAINDVHTEAIAGEDGYGEKGVPGQIQFIFLDGNGNRVKEGIVVQTDLLHVLQVDSTGTFSMQGELGKEYTLKITQVPTGYKMPSKSAFKFVFTENGFKRTIILYKIGKESKDQYASLDAAVALNIISSEAIAEVRKGAFVDTDGNVTVHAEGTTTTTAESKGSAKASSVAVGGSVAVNIVDERVAALWNGTGTIGGNAEVTAVSNSADTANAYATASGLQLDRFKSKFNAELDEILAGTKLSQPRNAIKPTNVTGMIDGALYGKSGASSTSLSGTNGSLMTKVLEALGVKTSETQANTGSTETTGDKAVSADTAKNEATAQTGATGSTTTKETKVTVAAAVGANISNHMTEALVNGILTMKKGGSVTVKATNNNNFRALGTGAAVSDGTAIALGVAVAVNGSKAIAEIRSNIGSETSKAGNILVQADTNINLSGGFEDDIAAQAIAGAGKGSESGGAAVAGAVAIIVNNAETTARIAENTAIYSTGSVKVLANEKIKLALRAWGASLSNSLFAEQNPDASAVVGGSATTPVTPDEKGTGIGAAFAVLYSNSQTTASIGNGVYIMADSLDVIAQKLRVSSGDYRFDGVQLNGQLTIGTKPQTVIQINTTQDANSTLPLKFNDVFQEGLSLLNVLASKNYYVEAAGGSVAENSSFSAAGSFAVIVLKDSLKALIGDHVTLVLTKNATVKADSDINMITIGGALAYGNKVGAGLSSTVIVNHGVVTALIGNGLNYTGGHLTVNADAGTDILTLLVAASAAAKDTSDPTAQTQTAISGVVNVYVSDMTVTAGIGEDAAMTSSGDVAVSAAHTLNHIGVVGGASLSSGLGIGASTGVFVIGQDVLAYIAQGGHVTANNIYVTADQNSKLIEIIVNGALAAGSDAKAAISVSPAVHVVKNKTNAYLGTPLADPKAAVAKSSRFNAANNIEVKALDNTFILVVSGGAAVSTQNSGVGGSVQVNVFLKEVNAIVGTGTANAYVTVVAPGRLLVDARSSEDIYAFVVGLGGGSKASAAGSVDVLVLSNQVTAGLGDYVRVGNEQNKGDIEITASDRLNQVTATGSVVVSTGGAAIGLANADIIIDGDVNAYIGKQAVIYGKNVTVQAASQNNLVSVVISGGVSTGGAEVSGSVLVTVLNQNVKALINEGSAVYADGQVKVHALSDVNLVDAVGNLGVSTGSAAVGGAVDTVVFGGKTLAIIEKGVTVDATGNIRVIAEAKENLTNVVIGLSASGGNAAVSGSVAVITKQQLVAAILGHMDESAKTVDGTGIDIRTDGSIEITAKEDSDLLVVAGSLAGTSGQAGVGAGVIVVTDKHVTWAEIGSKALADAMGKTPVTGDFGTVATTDIIPDGSKDLTYKKKKRGQQTVYGVLVGAYTNSTLNLIAVSAAGGGQAGVSAATATLVEKQQTIARIGSAAKVNTRGRESGARASVHVVAASDTSDSVAGGGAAIGGSGGVSGTVVTFTGNKLTLAEIQSGGEIYADTDLVVQALSDTGIFVNGIGFAGGGTAGVGATASVIVMKDITRALAGGKLTANTGSILVIADADERLQLSAVSAAGGGTAGVGAAIGVLVFQGETVAKVYTGSKLLAALDIKVAAFSDEQVVMTVIGAAGGGTAGVSGSVAVLVMNVVTQAVIGDGTEANPGNVSAGRNIFVNAADRTNLIVAAGGAAGGGAAGVGIAVEVAVYRNTVTAKVGNYNHLDGQSITVTANADRTVNTHAVMAAGGGTANVNGSILVLAIGTATTDSDADTVDGQSGLSTNTSKEASERGQAAVDYAFGQRIDTGNNNTYINGVNEDLAQMSDSLNGSGNFISGYFTTANVEDKTAAMIGNGGSSTTILGDIQVHASENTTIYATAGNVGGSGTASFGVSANIGLLAGTVEATLGGVVNSAANVSVKALSMLNVAEFAAIGGGGSGAAAANGTVTVLKTDNKATAKINSGAVVVAGHNVVVYADSDTDVLVINGNVGGAGAAAVGAAVNIVIFNGRTMAVIEGAQVTANANGAGVDFMNGGVNASINDKAPLDSTSTDTKAVQSEAATSLQKGVLVGAHSSQNIRNWVASAGGAGAASVMGSINVVVFKGMTNAYITNSRVTANGNEADIVVLAVDHTAIQNVIGNISGAGAAAVGLGNDTIHFEKAVSAKVTNGELTSGRHILIMAYGKEDFISVVAGAGGAGGVAVNSSDAVIVMKNTVEAIVADSRLTADGSILLTAEDEQNYVITAGSANGAGGVGVGAGVVALTTENTTKAQAAGTTDMDALGLCGVNTYDGTFSGTGRDRRRNKSLQYGVLIGAFNRTNLIAVAFAASGSGASSSVAASATVVSKTHVIAETGNNVKINQRNRENRSRSSAVKVLALDSSVSDVDGGGAAGSGGVGVTAVVVVTLMNKEVSAVLGGQVYAPSGILVQADSYDYGRMMAAGVAGGFVGVSGTASALKYQNFVTAKVNGTLKTEGDVQILANMVTDLYLMTGSASGGAVGAGASVLVFLFNGTTRAYAAAGSSITAANLVIKAESTEKLTSVSAALGGGRISGAISALVVIAEATTQAYTEDGVILKVSGQTTIQATDTPEYTLTAGSLSGGGASAAGAVIVLIFKNTVSAVIGTNNQITTGNLRITAETLRKLNVYSTSGSGGGGAVSGNVIVISVGQAMNDADTKKALGSVGQTAQDNASASLGQVKLDAQNGDKRNGNDIRNMANGYIDGISVNVLAYFNAAALANKVTAAIMSGGTIHVNGILDVTAKDTTKLDALSGSAAGGGLAAGGSVLITHMNGTTESYVGGTVISNGSAMNVVSEQTINAANYKAFTGTAGAVGLGAAVAWMNVTGINSAYTLEGSSLTGFGVITVKAVQNISVNPQAIGASTGAAAAGVATAKLIVSGTNKAELKAGTIQGTALNLLAYQTIHAVVTATSAAGGYFGAGNGAIALTDIYGTNEVVSAANLQIIGAAVLGAYTSLTSEVTAKGLAVSVGGSVGVPVARLNVNPKVHAYITGGTSHVGSLVMKAYYNINAQDKNLENKVSVNVQAGAAAGLVSAATNFAYLNLEGESKALISGGNLISDGAIAIYVKSYLKETGTGSSLSVSGGAAVGAVIVHMTENFTTEAGITDGTVSGRTIDILAFSESVSTLSAQAAGGGLLAGGVGAEAKADINSVTRAYLRGIITSSESIQVMARKLQAVNAKGKGVAAAGGAAVGVTKVTLNINPTAESLTRGQITAGTWLKVYALYNKDMNLNSTNHQINVEAKAGSGAALAAGSGVDVSIIQKGTVRAIHDDSAGGFVHAGNITAATGEAVTNRLADNYTTTRNIHYIAASHTNISLSAGGRTFAGGAAIGAVFAAITDQINTRAIVNGTLAAEEDILVRALHTSDVNGYVQGSSGGILAAGTAQQLTMAIDAETEAKAGGNIRAGYDFGVLSANELNVTGTVNGWSASGFASGGKSMMYSNLNSRVVARIMENSVIKAGQDITVHAFNAVDKKGTAQSSSGALGASGSNAEEKTNANYITYTDIGKNKAGPASMTSGYEMNIMAVSDHTHYGYATAIAGAIVAKGTAAAMQTVSDKVVVYLFEPVLISRKGGISIHSRASMNTTQQKAMGGAGGVANGNSLYADSILTQVSEVNFVTVAGKGALVQSYGTDSDISIQSETVTKADVQAQIQFSVSGLNTLGTQTYNQMVINSSVYLGDHTVINSLRNLYISAWIREIFANAWSYSKTTAVVNTQSRPLAEVNVTGNSRIEGNNVSLTAAQTLQVLADASENSKIYTKAYAYGETAGGTGSVVSVAKNNTRLYGTIRITGENSVFRGRDIIIEASVPIERNVQYSKQAVYKAYTVTELIKQAIVKTKTVIETVSEKICKWLPWPLNKLVKWITKQVIKVITWVEEITIVKVLKSETDAQNLGQYTSANSIELHGHIYYGSNAPIRITVDANGNFDDPNVRYEKNGDTIIIKSYDSKATGSLKINSQYGVVKGSVKVHTLSMISEMTITNNSNYHLVIENLNLQTNEDRDACNYNVYCSDDSGFVMDDVADITSGTAPRFSVYTNKGTNVTYNGQFSYYTANMLFQFNGLAGDLIFGENGNIGVNRLTVINARNVGTINAPWKSDMYVVTDVNGQWILPVVSIDATGDVYTGFTVKKYVEVDTEKEAQEAIKANESIRSLVFENIQAGGNVRIYMNPAIFVIALLTDQEITQKHEYTVKELAGEALNGEVETIVDREIHEFDNVVYVRETDGVLTYYKDSACTEIYDYSYTGKILYMKLVRDENYGIDNEFYYMDAECQNQITNVTFETIFDTEGFMDYLVTTETNGGGKVTYTYKPMTSDDYKRDEDNNLLIRDGDTFRVIADNEAIIYLKKLTDGKGGVTYISEVPITGYQLLGKETYTYKIGDTILEGYAYFQKENGIWYGYKFVEKTMTQESNVFTKNTIQTPYTVDGYYVIRNLKADGNIRLNPNVSGDHRLNVDIEGNVLTSGENDVLFNGTGHVTMHMAPGGTFGGENANVTIHTEQVTSSVAGKRLEIIGKTITVTTEKGFGTETNPVAVTMKDSTGSGFNVTEKNQGSVYLESYSDFYIGKVTVPDTEVISMNLHKNHLFGIDNTHLLKGGRLILMDAGNIGTETDRIQTRIGNGGFTIVSNGNIYLNQTGDARIQLIEALNRLELTVTGNIINISDGAAIQAKDIILKAEKAIGTAEKPLMMMQLPNGSLKALANGSLWLDNQSDDLNIISVISTNGDVTILSKTNIFDAGDGSEETVQGQKVTLEARNTIGTEGTPLTVRTEHLTATAGNQIWVDAGACELEVLLKALEVHLNALTVNGEAETDVLDVTAEGDIRLNAAAINGLLDVHQILSKTGSISLTSQDAVHLVKGEAEVNAEIFVQKGDLAIDELTAKELIRLSSEGSILNCSVHTLPGEENQPTIITDRLEMDAGNSIGAADNCIIAKAYSDAGVLTLNASAENGIYIHDISDILLLETLKSTEGSIELTTDGHLKNGLPEGSDETNVTGKNICITADRAGETGNPLTTNLVVDETLPSDENALIIRTEGDIIVHDIGTEGVLPITEMISKNGNVDFEADRSTEINVLNAENGSITIRIDGDFDMKELKAGETVNIFASGNITGCVYGDLIVGNLAAGTDKTGKDITLTIVDGSILNGLTADAENPVNLDGVNITLTTEETEGSEVVSGIGRKEKPIVTRTDPEGQLDVISVDSVYLTDVSTREENEKLQIGTIRSETGEIVLISETDTHIDEMSAVNGEVTLTTGGGITVGTLTTPKMTLQADGPIDITSEEDIVLDEISDGEGVTEIRNLTSQKGSILLTTARDTEIGTLSAVEMIDMTINGDVSVEDLKLGDENHRLLVNVSGDADIQADQTLLHVEDAEVSGILTLGNAGEIIIDRLAAPAADITSIGNLTVGYVDTDATEITANVTEGGIDILAKGDLTLTETSDGEGTTQITRLESETGSLDVTTTRDTVIEEIRTPENLVVETDGKLDILHGEAAGLVNLKADRITADFEGNLRVERIEAKNLELNLYKGSLFNGREDEEANLIAGNAVLNVYSKVNEDDEAVTADIGQKAQPFRTMMQEDGSFDIYADDTIYLEDVNTEETLTGPVHFGTLTSGSGEIVLVTGTDTRIDEMSAVNGEVTLTTGGGITVGTLTTPKMTLQADGPIDITSEEDIVLDEISDGEGVTEIRNLTSQKGSILLTTARDTEIGTLSAVEMIDMTINGDVSVEDLKLGDENHRLLVNVSGDADIQADQTLLHVEDAEVSGILTLGNAGEIIIDRLAAPAADITSIGNLTVGYVDTDATEITANVTEGGIDILAKGDLTLTETSDGEGTTQITRLESETGSLDVTTTRDTVIEEIRTPENLVVETDGKLDILHGEAAGLVNLKADRITADFEGNLRVERIEAKNLELNLYKGSLFNGREDEEANLIAGNAVLNVYSKVNEDDEAVMADVGRTDRPFYMDIEGNGGLSIKADGNIYLKDIGEESTLILPQITADGGNVALTAKRPIFIRKLTAEKLLANISNGTLSLNTPDALKLILTGEENHLGDLTIDGALDITSENAILTDGRIQAVSTRFSAMKNLKLQMMASMGEVTIVSRPDGQTRVHLMTTESDEIVRFMADILEIQTGDKKQEIHWVNVPAGFTLENPGGNNIYEIYTLKPETEILSGKGNDVYYIGMLCEKDNPETAYKILWNGEEQWMSKGNLNVLNIRDNGGENVFHIQHAENKINLYGSHGDDTYILAGYYIWNEEIQMYEWYWALDHLWIEDLYGNNVYIGFPASYFGVYSDGVATGDGTPVGWLMLLMLISGTAIFWSLKKRKQR